MKQLGISVTLKYTKAMPRGSFKSLSISTDAMIEEGDDPSRARRLLYLEVAEDLRACFSNNARKPGDEVPAPPSPRPKKQERKPRRRKSKPKGNPNRSDKAWCYIHECAMQEHSKKPKNGKTQRWYSHKLADGTWCNGRAKK